ncbi:MAG: EpsI family protein [Acidobacteriota bacterium]|jgi:EpsI family protein|nr:EpsI family protein [Acidobacteriota bacterium]
MKVRIVILSLFLLAAAAVISYASRPEVVPLRQSLEGLPMHLDGWSGQRSPDMDQKVLDVLGVDDYIDRVYYQEGDGSPVGLYIGYYQSQRAGDTIHSPLNCLPGAGWNPVRNEHVIVPVDGGRTIEINRITIQKGANSQVVLYWYQSHGRAIASEYKGKVYTVLDALRTNRTDAALVRVICPVRGASAAAEDAAEKTAVEFTQTLFPLLGQYLPD